MITLSIVVPSYNEAENITQTIRDIQKVANTLVDDYEIIIVNDGSSDNTGDIIKNELLPNNSHIQLVEHFPNRGYGGALKAGFEAAQKEFIAFVPGDGQFKFDEISLFIDKLTPKISLVSGVRVDRKDNIVRKANAFLWNCVIRLFFGKLVSDIDCGFKVFRRNILDGIVLTSNGAMIDTEMLATLKVHGYKFDETPVTHLPRVAGNPTGANPVVIMKAFRDLFLVRVKLWKYSILRNKKQ